MSAGNGGTMAASTRRTDGAWTAPHRSGWSRGPSSFPINGFSSSIRDGNVRPTSGSWRAGRPVCAKFQPISAPWLARGIILTRPRVLPKPHQPSGVGAAEQQRQHPARPGPAGLVARAYAGAIVTVEVLVEQDQVTPMRVVLQHRLSTVDRAVPGRVLQECAHEASGKVPGHLVQGALTAGSGWAFHGELVAEVAVQVQQCPDQHD